MVNANITPTAASDGILYSNSVPLTSSEAALNGGTGGASDASIPIVQGQTIVAVVQLSINGYIASNNTYLVLQTDLGDGVWVDVAWIVYIGTEGSATFVMCGGGLGQQNNAFQQSRQSGAHPTPQANGSNVVSLGGRVRFIGKSLVAGGSAVAGTTAEVSATITYRLQNPL